MRDREKKRQPANSKFDPLLYYIEYPRQSSSEKKEEMTE
jgi:hypothetical protein